MIDYEFIAKMLRKQKAHYSGFIRATERQIDDYDRQLASFAKLINAGDVKWKPRQREMEFKKTEALTKLGEAVASLANITAQLKEKEFPQIEELNDFGMKL